MHILCLEKAHPCGPEGYALAYGKYYCGQFQQYFTSFSSQGQQWVTAVTSCLQEALIPIVDNDDDECDEIREYAFSTHAGCYTNPEHSICCILPTDWILIFVVIRKQLNNSATWQNLLDVANTCGTEYYNNIISILDLVGRLSMLNVVY